MPMAKKNLGVVFGGMSTEHEVSIVSGISVIKKLNQEKYEIFPTYINEEGLSGKYYIYLKINGTTYKLNKYVWFY